MLSQGSPTFVEFEAKLVLDERLLREVVLMELWADDVPQGGGSDERAGHGHDGRRVEGGKAGMTPARDLRPVRLPTNRVGHKRRGSAEWTAMSWSSAERSRAWWKTPSQAS